MLLASFNFGRVPGKFFRVRVWAFVAPGSRPSPARRRQKALAGRELDATRRRGQVLRVLLLVLEYLGTRSWYPVGS